VMSSYLFPYSTFLIMYSAKNIMFLHIDMMLRSIRINYLILINYQYRKSQYTDMLIINQPLGDQRQCGFKAYILRPLHMTDARIEHQTAKSQVTQPDTPSASLYISDNKSLFHVSVHVLNKLRVVNISFFIVICILYNGKTYFIMLI
jgi:hypothetical protein